MLFDRFRRDRRGNVVPIFALAIVPVIGFVGAAVDYSRAAAVRTSMQAALDATALALHKEAPGLTADQLNEKATQLFKATFTKSAAENVQVTAQLVSTTSGFNLRVAATGSVDTTFARVLGQTEMQIGSSSEVTWGIKKLELALALDNTGSMASSNKMVELKKAANDLVDTLKAAAKKPDDIKISIVPFGTAVNVGTSNVAATWLDWTHWEAPPANSMPAATIGPGSSCPYSTNDEGYRCTTGPTNGSSTTDYVPSSGTYKGYICPSLKDGAYFNGCYNSVEKPSSEWNTVSSGWYASCGSTPNCSCTGSGNGKVCKQKTYSHTWIANAHSTWNGCVWDRDQDDDVKDTTPTASNNTKLQPHQTTTCPVATMALTNDWTAMHTKINSMTPTGNTNVTIGLAWGWHSLTAGAPMTEGATASTALDKVIILLTDGDNTQNRWSRTQSTIDARTKLACANAKAAGIKLYTIRVIEGSAALLKECATNSGMYYSVNTASELSGVFSTIAKNLANLRIAK